MKYNTDRISKKEWKKIAELDNKISPVDFNGDSEKLLLLMNEIIEREFGRDFFVIYMYANMQQSFYNYYNPQSVKGIADELTEYLQNWNN